MPLPNEHACRIRNPDDFQKGSFRRIKRGKLSIIIGRLRGKITTTTQAFRYPIGTWTASQARAHCQRQKGSFEAAQPKKEAGVSEQVDYVQVGGVEEQPESETYTDAIYKEQKMYDEVMFSSATSFDELEAHEQAQVAAQEVRSKAAQFQMLVNNIMSSPDVEDKAAALGKLASEFTGKVGEAMSETKETDDKAVWTTKYINGLPDGSFLYIEPGGERDNEGKTKPRTLRHFPYRDSAGKIDLPHLRNAIQRIPQSNAKGLTATKKRSLQERARRILRRQQKGLVEYITDTVKSWFGVDEPESDRKPGFTVWKEADGTYRWFAVFSNKYRDRDNPPEILSDAAHKEFVEAVDAGNWPYPKLWLWHVKGSESGHADWLHYDEETGFNCASGVVANKQVAENLVGMGDLLVSHGMPVEHIKRDMTDSTIITGYRSIEISPLPSWAAANELTDFALLKEVDNMAIPEEKKDFLRQAGLSDEQIATIEDGLKEKAEEAREQDLEFKDTGEEEQAGSQEQATESTEAEPAGSGEVEDSSLTRDEVVEAIAAAFQPLQQQLEALTLVQAEQAKALKELLQTDQEKMAEKASLTPAASLAELVAQRVIGSPEAKVDGRTSLAKSGPKETEPTEPILNPTPVNFINQLLAGGNTVN